MTEQKPILRVRNLKQSYQNGSGIIHALRNVSFNLFPGEILGIVGESGSGKSTLMRALYLDEVPLEGELFLENIEEGLTNIFTLSSQRRRKIKNQVLGKVYQNPRAGLKMDFSALANVCEKMIDEGNRNVGKMTQRGRELLGAVKIPLTREKDPPKNFSGGMQQRVQIAKALSNNPPILLLDEVTTGLDLSVQAKVLDIIKELRHAMGMSIIIVSHDLAVVRLLADRTLVMLNGEIIEHGLTDQILEDPQHPYSQELVQSLL